MCSMKLRVDAVVVPPLKCGIAYGHTDKGECATFTGERAAMLDLCSDVKAYSNGARGPVYVDAAHWRDVCFVGADECPAHWSSVA